MFELKFSNLWFMADFTSDSRKEMIKLDFCRIKWFTCHLCVLTVGRKLVEFF